MSIGFFATRLLRPSSFKRPIAFGILGLALSACFHDEDESDKTGAKASPPSVVVAGIESQDVTQFATFVGRVEPVASAKLIARVDGFLEGIEIEDGATVKSGDLLFRIEKENYEAALVRAEAEVAEAKAKLALAEIEMERDTKLLASDTIAQSRYDATLAKRESFAALLKAAGAQVRSAALDLSYTEILAPFDGRIGGTAFSVGDVVGATKGPIAELISVSPIYVNFSLSEGDFVTIMQKSDFDISKRSDPENSPPVSVILANDERFDKTGTIVFVDNQIDAATGTIALRAKFENPKGLLTPGAFVNVEIGARKATLRLLAPQASVQRDQRGDFVLAVNEQGDVEQRYVELGPQHETFFIVESGLQAGDAVIVEGLQRVRPGVRVKAVRSTEIKG